jgi:hypothetical protein
MNISISQAQAKVPVTVIKLDGQLVLQRKVASEKL